jgi:hypothetical protein
VSGHHPFNRLGSVGLGVSRNSTRETFVKSRFLRNGSKRSVLGG